MLQFKYVNNDKSSIKIRDTTQVWLSDY